MPTLTPVLQTLNSRLAVVTADLKKFAALPKLNDTQKFQCKLLFQKRDGLLNQINAFSQAEANLRRVIPASQPLKVPVLNSKPQLSGDDLRDLMRLDQIRVGSAAIPAAQAHDALMARFNALQPGSTPIPAHAYAYRTDLQKRELLDRELFLTTPGSKVLSAEGCLYHATSKYIKTGLTFSSSQEISKACDLKQVTFEQSMSLRFRFSQNVALINAKLEIMSAFENSDMAKRKSMVEQVFNKVNGLTCLNHDQKITTMYNLKAWIQNRQSSLHATALKPASRSFKPGSQ